MEFQNWRHSRWCKWCIVFIGLEILKVSGIENLADGKRSVEIGFVRASCGQTADEHGARIAGIEIVSVEVVMVTTLEARVALAIATDPADGLAKSTAESRPAPPGVT